jgi:hypothetical protein
MILFSSSAQMAAGRVQSPSQFVAGLFPRDKSTRRATDHLRRPSRAEVMNAWSYTSTSPYVLLAPTGTPLPLRHSFICCYVLIARPNGIFQFVMIFLAHNAWSSLRQSSWSSSSSSS